MYNVISTISGQFRLYHAMVDDTNHTQVTCLENTLHCGVFISWNTGSQSIEFFVSCKCVSHITFYRSIFKINNFEKIK